MSYSSDAAEQVVRMSLEGAEVAVKLAGAGAKQLAILLFAILQEQKKTKGKTRLTNMLRSGKELKVFAVKDADLQLFCREAKKYGVLYCVLKDREATDGITDVMVRAEDASKINRIFERFDLATVDMASVRSEMERSRADRGGEAPAAEPMTEQETEELLDALFQPAPVQEGGQAPNPFTGFAQEQGDLWRTDPAAAKSRQSEPTSGHREQTSPGISDPPERSRPSVRQELDEIRAEQREKAAGKEKAPRQEPAQHRAPHRKKSKKTKER